MAHPAPLYEAPGATWWEAGVLEEDTVTVTVVRGVLPDTASVTIPDSVMDSA